jgi:hypothetical protein
MITTGTEKQIKWAEDLKSKTISALDKLESYTITNVKDQRAKDVINGYRSELQSKINATWWIDNRYDLPTEKMSERDILASFNELMPDVYKKVI